MIQVLIVIEGGVFHNVECPIGVEVVVHDYDVEVADRTGYDFRKDSDGVEYIRKVYRNPVDRPR